MSQRSYRPAAVVYKPPHQVLIESITKTRNDIE